MKVRLTILGCLILASGSAEGILRDAASNSNIVFCTETGTNRVPKTDWTELERSLSQALRLDKSEELPLKAGDTLQLTNMEMSSSWALVSWTNDVLVLRRIATNTGMAEQSPRAFSGEENDGLTGSAQD